jgi:hypothetical protein
MSSGRQAGLGIGSATVGGLLIGAIALYALGFQRWVYGDGPQLIETFLFQGELWMHVLYIPAARLLAWLPGSSPLGALRWSSILGGAVGVAGVYLLARAFGARPGRAVLASLLAATTPAVWFFSTTIEVHALHFGVVSLSSYIVARTSWNRSWLSLLATVAPVPLLYLTHRSGALLAPGWLALALHVRERQTGERTRWTSFFLVAGSIALVMLASMLLGAALVPARNSLGGTLDFLSQYRQGFSLGFFREALLLGLGCLLPLAVFGVGRTSKQQLLVLGAFLLPSLAFFTWYGEANNGGYFVSIVPFLAVLAERALPSGRAAIPAALVAIAIQATLSLGMIASHARQFSWEDRVARAALVRDAIGESGTVVSFEPTNQPITLDLPGIRELNRRSEFMKAAARGVDPVDSARGTMEYLRYLAGKRPGRILLDLGLERRVRNDSRLEPRLREIENAAALEFGPIRGADSRFPMVIVR